ncbi:MAG: hypothetical protein RLZ47_307 [Bacteroidota bacterium]|jgi:predicted HicB family RNase H-like nuclease
MKKDILVYKRFTGSVHFSADDSVFFGKIEGINDLITFEGSTVNELTSAFHESVDEYIKFCEENNRPLMKSYNGIFNVRIKPQLHQKASIIATIKGMTLNQFVQSAIESRVEME